MVGMLKWWLIFTASLAALAFCTMLGLVQKLWVADVSKLSFTIIGIYLLLSAFTGVLTYRAAIRGDEVDAIKYRDFLNYLPEMMTCLGLLGAVGGFSYSLISFGSLDFGNVQAMQAMMQKMTSGVSTAVISTFTGILSAVLLSLQHLNLKLLTSGWTSRLPESHR